MMYILNFDFLEARFSYTATCQLEIVIAILELQLHLS